MKSPKGTGQEPLRSLAVDWKTSVGRFAVRFRERWEKWISVLTTSLWTWRFALKSYGCGRFSAARDGRARWDRAWGIDPQCVGEASATLYFSKGLVFNHYSPSSAWWPPWRGAEAQYIFFEGGSQRSQLNFWSSLGFGTTLISVDWVFDELEFLYCSYNSKWMDCDFGSFLLNWDFDTNLILIGWMIFCSLCTMKWQ